MKAYSFPDYDTPVWVWKRVAVVGGGNVAMDSARTALRLGAEKVTVVYRRSRAEMPARLKRLKMLRRRLSLSPCKPVRILSDDKGWVKGMECVRMELGEEDSSGRRRLSCSRFRIILDVDTVISAVGTDPNPLLVRTIPGLIWEGGSNVIIDEETGMTNIPECVCRW